MEMKKIACAVLISAASMSAVFAEVSSPAPAPTSDSAATFPIIGSLVGASVLSFFAMYFN
ncbi:hypothetical protein ACSBR1_020549 [Camellia fascicularis]|uniref:arabinogalactan protein 23-like n=1 Tax=Camellia sinensis TaxID=4442 RepID=UPI001035E03E|nr:arabinogalactan protein 23-like [Camellia sinensis]